MELIKDTVERLERENKDKPYYQIPRLIRDTTNIIPFVKGSKTEYAWWVFAPNASEPEDYQYKQYQSMAIGDKAIREWEGNFAMMLGDPLNLGTYWVDIDIDDPDRWPAYADRGGLQLTSGRGYHLLFLSERQLRAIQPAPGVEIRTKGITFIPPSIHPSGQEYRWID